MVAPTKAQRTATRIAAGAGELFFSQGFAQTTIAQVAEVSGVAVGTVMLHFGSKAELATAAFAGEVARVVERAAAALNADGSSDVETELAAFVRPIYTWYDTHGEVAPDLLREALFTTGPWGEFYAETVADTVAVFAAIAGERNAGDASAVVVGQGLLADYLLILLYGLRGQFESVEHQVEAFVTQASARW